MTRGMIHPPLHPTRMVHGLQTLPENTHNITQSGDMAMGGPEAETRAYDRLSDIICEPARGARGYHPGQDPPGGRASAGGSS